MRESSNSLLAIRASLTDPRQMAVFSSKRLSKMLGAAASVIMLGVSLWFLHRELAGLSRGAITAQLGTMPPLSLLASLALTACSYLVLTAYDVAALRYIHKPVPYRRAALTSFMAYAVGYNVGIAALSGGSIRYRMYTGAGLTASDIARVVVFVAVTFGLGTSMLLGAAFLLMPTAEATLLTIPTAAAAPAGALLLAAPIGYLAITVLRRRPVSLGSWNIAVPAPSIAVAQIAASVIDLVLASAALYVLLAPILHVGYFPFLGLYLLAMCAGLVSSVPGGIGVFEAVLVAALPGVAPGALLGTIIAYRLIYYIAPLALALLLLIGHESRQHGQFLRRSGEAAGEWLSGVAPYFLGTMVFLAGAVLLVSDAIPAVESRLALISKALPLPVLELSHLAGSVVGTGLLILAHGLYRRLHAAYVAALLALSAGIVLSLFKGLDYEEALILGGVLYALWLSRRHFYRQGSIASQPFPARWIAAIVVGLSVALWAGLVSFRHVAYSDQLWWQFAFDAEAPRMLRATLVAAVTALGFALWKTLHAAAEPPAVGTADMSKAIRRVIASASNASANAALLGDKRFLWSVDEAAFIMYQVSGRSWIALGDPVGPEQHFEELGWAFRELVDRHDGRPVFYEVSDKSLSLYVDLGLALSKLGEEARVFLGDFTLQGSRRAELRQAQSRAGRHGATFEIVPRTGVPAITAELRQVSDRWLADKATAEKGFSLGSFSERYIENFDCAIVRVNDEIVAFTNLWPAQSGGEFSVDLMRYDQRAPKGVMDYLFVELMLWGRASGYQWFSLGMAPLAGLEQRPLAPLWHKLGHLIFTQGENFYNFEGLRSYKQKFDPDWKPRYLACPGGWLNLPQSLFDASRLISGGVSGVLGKKN